MSLSLTKGDPIGFINGKIIKLSKDNETNNQPILKKKITKNNLLDLYDMPPLRDESKEMKFDKGDIILLPTKGKTDRIYICGPTGSGKTFWISQYLEKYKQIYPNRPIYIFSDVDKDELLDKHKPIRIKLNMSLHQKPIQTHELKDSCVIFDDVDSISDKNIKNAVITLYDSILKKGSSHDNISLIITNHACTDRTATRNILINSNFIVFFPKSGSSYGLNYMLKNYMGLSKEQIARVFNLPSRWVVLHKNFPLWIMYSTGIYLL